MTYLEKILMFIFVFYSLPFL